MSPLSLDHKCLESGSCVIQIWLDLYMLLGETPYWFCQARTYRLSYWRKRAWWYLEYGLGSTVLGIEHSSSGKDLLLGWPTGSRHPSPLLYWQSNSSSLSGLKVKAGPSLKTNLSKQSCESSDGWQKNRKTKIRRNNLTDEARESRRNMSLNMALQIGVDL